MSKPVRIVKITTAGRKSSAVPAVFDTGSFYTIIRRDCLPAATPVSPLGVPLRLRGATRGSRLRILGQTGVIITLGKVSIRDDALVAANLAREMIVGAGTMQKWDISVRNKNGATRVVMGADMRDPEITEVD